MPRFQTDRLIRERFADWRDAPLVAVTAVNGALRVCGVNAAAQAAGVGPGLPLADARALVPTLKAVEAEPEAEAALLDQMAEWATRWTPWTAVEGLDGTGGAALWLDIAGCAHLFGGEEALVRDLLTRLGEQGFCARVGVGDTKGAAWAACRFLDPDQPFAIIPEGAARQILPSLPVAALRLDAATVETLRRLGLRTIGDLLALPRGPLAARFGKAVAERLDQALGHAREPFTPRQPPAPYRLRLGFPEPLGLLDDVAAGLRLLLDGLCARLERDGKGARRLVLEAFRVDGTVSRTALGTARAVRDPVHLARLFRDRLEDLDAGFGIEALVLSVPVADPLSAAQQDISRRLRTEPQSAEKQREMALLVDRLGARLGTLGVVRPVAHASHLPERAVAAANPLEPSGADALWPPRPRPPHLLPRPERVETSPAPPGAPPPFCDGVPSHVRWRRHTLRLVRAEGPERISPEWWAGPAQARDYWRVEDAAGRRLWLFAQAGEWFLHGGLE